MALTVKALTGAETIRDGGLLAAFFRDEDGEDWILLLPLRQASHDGQWKKLGFDDPLLIDAAPERRPSDTPKQIYSVLSGPSSSLTWPEAQALTAQFVAHSTTLGEQAGAALSDLCAVVASNGKLPPGMARFVATHSW